MLKLLYFFLIITFFNGYKTLKCDQQEIENCLQCGTGENSDTCAKCPETHFLFNHNLRCVPCNDTDLGDSGCEKNCVANFETRYSVDCPEDSCYEGYFNINGKCMPIFCPLTA